MEVQSTASDGMQEAKCHFCAEDEGNTGSANDCIVIQVCETAIHCLVRLRVFGIAMSLTSSRLMYASPPLMMSWVCRTFPQSYVHWVLQVGKYFSVRGDLTR